MQFENKTDIFISKISVRRPLWDVIPKDVKSKLWVEVAAVIVENWDQLSTEEKIKKVRLHLMTIWVYSNLTNFYRF